MSENFRADTQGILESLSLFLGIDDLKFSEEDETCTLQLDEKVQINITLNATNETLVLHHLMGVLPESNRAEIMEQLLEANLFWSGTNGATISMERDTSFVIIARALTPYQAEGNLLTGEELATAIADLANAATSWRALLENQNITSEEEHAEYAQEQPYNGGFDITALD